MNFDRFYQTQITITLDRPEGKTVFGANCAFVPVGISQLTDAFPASADEAFEFSIRRSDWQSPFQPQKGDEIQMGEDLFAVASVTKDDFQFILNCKSRGGSICSR